MTFCCIDSGFGCGGDTIEGWWYFVTQSVMSGDGCDPFYVNINNKDVNIVIKII